MLNTPCLGSESVILFIYLLSYAPEHESFLHNSALSSLMSGLGLILFIPHNWPYLETEVVQLGVLSSRMVSLTLLCVASCRFSSFSYFLVVS